MRRHIHFFLLGLAAGALMSPGRGLAQRDRFQQVTVENLQNSPQSYWNRGIVFTDTYTDPPSGREIAVSGDRYAEIGTEQLGLVYATPALVPQLEKMQLNHECTFSGTVLSRESGFLFGSQKQYIVVITKVRQVTPLDLNGVVESLKGISDSPEESVRYLSMLLKMSQEGLSGHARDMNVELRSLIDPNSEHVEKTGDIIRKAVRDLEGEENTTSQEILTMFIRYLLQQQLTGSNTEKPMKAPVKIEPPAKPIEKKPPVEPRPDLNKPVRMSDPVIPRQEVQPPPVRVKKQSAPAKTTKAPKPEPAISIDTLNLDSDFQRALKEAQIITGNTGGSGDLFKKPTEPPIEKVESVPPEAPPKKKRSFSLLPWSRKKKAKEPEKEIVSAMPPPTSNQDTNKTRSRVGLPIPEPVNGSVEKPPKASPESEKELPSAAGINDKEDTDLHSPVGR